MELIKRIEDVIAHIDHSAMKLGKRARRYDPRTLQLNHYLTLDLPPAPPPSVDYSHGITAWGLMCNDRLGCCTIAAVAHAIQTLSANASEEVTVGDDVILSYYEKWDGYNPANPATDQGGVELDVLNQWRSEGFAGHALNAYCAIKLMPVDVQEAIWLFGGAYIGVELPLTAAHQAVWDVPVVQTSDDFAGSWGGHAVYVVGYDAEGLTCVTWGQLKHLTWAWFQRYCTEAYALVAADWFTRTGLSPTGLDMVTLEADLKNVTA